MRQRLPADYLTLGEALAKLHKGRRSRRPVIVALTATASPPVREDIAARLRLVDPEIVITGAGPAKSVSRGICGSGPTSATSCVRSAGSAPTN